VKKFHEMLRAAFAEGYSFVGWVRGRRCSIDHGEHTIESVLARGKACAIFNASFVSLRLRGFLVKMNNFCERKFHRWASQETLHCSEMDTIVGDKEACSSRLYKCRHWKHIGITDQDKIDTQLHRKEFSVPTVNVYYFSGMNVDLNISFWSSGGKGQAGKESTHQY
jgi:hypothetical protein